MLAECDEHSYYRGTSCPVCKKDGKFLMDDGEVKKLSSIIIGVLRHFPDQFNVKMNSHGWVNVDELVDAVQHRMDRFYWVRKKHIVALALTDEKGRYQMEEGNIRATYAHTVEVDLSDLPDADIDVLYYPVTEEEVDIILEQGLLPSDRSKVHLSGTRKKALEAGRIRVETPVILAIDAKQALKDGVAIRKAGTDVYIADSIDACYVSRSDESVEEETDSDEPHNVSENES